MFGFKKRPENDINQYFAMIPRDKNWVKNSIEIIKVTDYNRDIALNKEDPFSKNVSIKRAIKYAKKHRAILSISPEGMTENNVFQYIKDHVPRELWKYSALSSYYKFN